MPLLQSNPLFSVTSWIAHRFFNTKHYTVQWASRLWCSARRYRTANWIRIETGRDWRRERTLYSSLSRAFEDLHLKSMTNKKTWKCPWNQRDLGISGLFFRTQFTLALQKLLKRSEKSQFTLKIVFFHVEHALHTGPGLDENGGSSYFVHDIGIRNLDML